MLTPDEAQQTLEKLKSPVALQQRDKLLSKLTSRLQETSRALVGVDAAGNRYRDWQERDRKLRQAASELDELSVAERKRTFAALFPQLADVVEAAWQAMQQQPYQANHVRKPFRAPQDPSATQPRRAQWLQRLLQTTAEYDQPLTWFAQWAAYLEPAYYPSTLAVLFAVAIDADDQQGQEIFDILRESANGEHEIGAMGRHVIRAFLSASRPEGWEFIERMLLAAQRQEGLRQSILETVDEAHPEAFHRMLRLIVEENLVRFAATVRAADVWLGLQWDSVSAGKVREILTQVLACQEEETHLTAALRGDDAEAAYFALWVLAARDIQTAIPQAARLLKHKQADMRFAAAVILNMMGYSDAMPPLLPALADEDLRVCAIAADAFSSGWYIKYDPQADVFPRLEQLLDRFPKKKTTLKPLLFPWYELTISRDAIAGALLTNLGDRPLSEFLPYLPQADPNTRYRVIDQIYRDSKTTPVTRATVLALVGDASTQVRRRALEAAGHIKITPAEAEQIEGYLTRKAGDLRRGVLAALLGQPDPKVLSSAHRLLESSSAMQRLAGLELLKLMIEKERQPEACRRRVDMYVESRGKFPDAEQTLIDAVLDTGREVATLDDALGLMNPAGRAEIPPVEACKVDFCTPAALGVLEALDNLIHVHRETPIELSRWGGSQEETLLGNAQWHFPMPGAHRGSKDEEQELPLREIWEQWEQARPARLRDNDGLEFYRAGWLLTFLHSDKKHFTQEMLGRMHVKPLPKLKYPEILSRLLLWMKRNESATQSVDPLLDMLETAYALLEPAEVAAGKSEIDLRRSNWRSYGSPPFSVRDMVNEHYARFPAAWNDQQVARLWRLERWNDEPVILRGKQREKVVIARNRPELELLLKAYDSGAATIDDVYDHLLGPRGETGYRGGHNALRVLTSRKPHELLKKYPWLSEIVEKCRRRIIDVELPRGETPTAASGPALSVSTVWGLQDFLRIATALGKDTLVRGWSSDSLGKPAVFSHLLRACLPLPEETAQDLAAAVKEANIAPKRLLEFAVYAPQWAALIEGVLNYPGLEDAVWWIHAHTKDNNWMVDQEIRKEWENEIAQRTPLSPADLVDGAVDIEWFQRTYGSLKKSKWEKLDAAAKYASGGGGHKRAQLFAEAMLGRAKKSELTARIEEKRHQDALRALGLLPLARGKSRENDLLSRYKLIQEFIRSSRKFGSQRQTSEKRAATIAQENLARTAGYQDPIRLQWAMEARAVADLADGPVEVAVGETTIALAIDERGQVDLSVTKNGKPLKSIPAAAKKHKEVKALQARRTEIKRQAARIRPTLEQMMCRGETITGPELIELMEHPLISPLLARLVVVGEGILGYPEKGGKVLRDHAGAVEPVKKTERLRLAHPHDLYERGDWHEWQRDCFGREIVQPFKQVFRELYPITAAELKEQTQSRRYAGQQVNPRQAASLLGTRQWLIQEGALKIFHTEDLAAHLEFQEAFYTPADVDGLTLETVCFTRRGQWKSLPLKDIPPRVFSEVMRDLDLVVSVAHRGGVDPEATASTVEMRANLLRETLALLDCGNVRIEKNHALIEGELASYSVHLGSAVVHKQPGGAVFLVAVHSQHRGRMFLPFADDDPKTAEVISKVLLLARDSQIKDPNLLDQIRQA